LTRSSISSAFAGQTIAELGDLALRDAAEAHRLHELVDPAGRHAADPGISEPDAAFYRDVTPRHYDSYLDRVMSR
jgi:hypothetical protein